MASETAELAAATSCTEVPEASRRHLEIAHSLTSLRIRLSTRCSTSLLAISTFSSVPSKLDFARNVMSVLRLWASVSAALRASSAFWSLSWAPWSAVVKSAFSEVSRSTCDERSESRGMRCYDVRNGGGVRNSDVKHVRVAVIRRRSSHYLSSHNLTSPCKLSSSSSRRSCASPSC